MTQRIELLVKLNLSYMTQRIELSRIWLKELNPFDLTRTIESFFLKVTHRIELFFFFERDSQNWFFSLKVTQRIEPFSTMSQRIKPFLKNDSKNWFSEKYQYKEIFFGWDSKNWLFLNYSQNWNIFPCDS